MCRGVPFISIPFHLYFNFVRQTLKLLMMSIKFIYILFKFLSSFQYLLIMFFFAKTSTTIADTSHMFPSVGCRNFQFAVIEKSVTHRLEYPLFAPKVKVF